MPEVSAAYTFSIELEHYHTSLRFHWVICSTRNPDRLVSWGHAPSRELAVAAAQREIKDLRSGRTVDETLRDSKSAILTRSH